jgi:hypothetical protein
MSHVGVAGGQHGGEAGRLFLAAAFLARLFKMPVAAHDFERALAVDLFLQSPQCFIHRLAFFEFNLGQTNSLPLQKTRDLRPSWRARPLESGAGRLFFWRKMSIGKMPVIERIPRGSGVRLRARAMSSFAETTQAFRRSNARLVQKSCANDAAAFRSSREIATRLRSLLERWFQIRA